MHCFNEFNATLHQIGLTKKNPSFIFVSASTNAGFLFGGLFGLQVMFIKRLLKKKFSIVVIVVGFSKFENRKLNLLPVKPGTLVTGGSIFDLRIVASSTLRYNSMHLLSFVCQRLRNELES